MSKRLKIILVVAVAAMLVGTLTVGGLVELAQRTRGELIATDVNELEPTNVAIVFGAGLVANSSRPSDMLYDRLQTAAEIFRAGKVRSILVSGDNRFEHYSEPDVMRQTLIDEFGIPEQAVHTDYAGRRTYDTCARAHGLWGVRRAILVTQDYHLPRAIMTCSALGIESHGISASLRPYRFMERYLQRERFAILKAYVDLYLWRPDYLCGPQEAQIDE